MSTEQIFNLMVIGAVILAVLSLSPTWRPIIFWLTIKLPLGILMTVCGLGLMWLVAATLAQH